VGGLAFLNSSSMELFECFFLFLFIWDSELTSSLENSSDLSSFSQGISSMNPYWLHVFWNLVVPYLKYFFLYFCLLSLAFEFLVGFVSSWTKSSQFHYLLVHVETIFEYWKGFVAVLHLIQFVFLALWWDFHYQQLWSSTIRILTVSAKLGRVSIILLSSDSSSLLWEVSSISG